MDFKENLVVKNKVPSPSISSLPKANEVEGKVANISSP